MAPPRSAVRHAVLEAFRTGVLSANEVRDRILDQQQYGAMHPLTAGEILSDGTFSPYVMPAQRPGDTEQLQLAGVPIHTDPRVPRDTVVMMNPGSATVTMIGANGQQVSFDASDVQFSLDPVAAMGNRLRENAEQLTQSLVTGSSGSIHGTFEHAEINWDAMSQAFGIERDKLPPNQPKYKLEDLPPDDFFENRTW